MTNSKENPPLTDIQKERKRELERKMAQGPGLTEKQMQEFIVLRQKEEKSKDVKLGDVAIQYLLEAYAWETEQMCSITKEMDVEYFERGRKTEPESIQLLREVDNEPYVKNEVRFDNEFLSGIPDVLSLGLDLAFPGHPGEDRIFAKAVKDIKSCKDYPTFLYKIHKGLDPGNKEQLQGYGDILECEDLGVVFTLPTMPQSIREGYKMKLAYKMDAAIDQDKEFEQAWVKLERSMIFDHMDPRKRVYKIPIAPFTSEERQQVYDRVKVCREWLHDWHEMYTKLNG